MNLFGTDYTPGTKSDGIITPFVGGGESIPIYKESPLPQTSAISLHKGFNLVTVCLMLATSLVSFPYFSTLGDLLLEGKQVLPGANTISGPIHFSGLSRMTQVTDHATPYPPVPSHPKSHPSVPIPTVGPQATGLLAEISDNINSLAAIPQTHDYCYTHVVIHSTRESATLPLTHSLAPLGQWMMLITLFYKAPQNLQLHR